MSEEDLVQTDAPLATELSGHQRMSLIIPNHVLDAMVEAVWEACRVLSMEETRNMLERAVVAARTEGYDLCKRPQTVVEERETCALAAEAIARDNGAPELGMKIARGIRR